MLKEIILWEPGSANAIQSSHRYFDVGTHFIFLAFLHSKHSLGFNCFHPVSQVTSLCHWMTVYKCCAPDDLVRIVP